MNDGLMIETPSLEDRLVMVRDCTIQTVLLLMESWGYTKVPPPAGGVGNSNQWWAGFINPMGVMSWAWADSPEEAIRVAAIKAINGETK